MSEFVKNLYQYRLLKPHSQLKKGLIPLLICLVFTEPLLAETVQICGLNYQSDDFNLIDSNTVKLEQSGNSEIVEYKTFELLALKKMFSENTKLAAGELSSCIYNLLKAGRDSLAFELLEHLIKGKAYKEQQLIELIASLVDFKFHDQLISDLLLKPETLDNSNALALFLAKERFSKDPAWLKKNSPKIFYRYNQDLKESLVNDLLINLIIFKPDHIEFQRKISGQVRAFNDYFGLINDADSQIFSLYDQLNGLILNHQEQWSFENSFSYYQKIHEYLKTAQIKIEPKITEIYLKAVHQQIEQELASKNYSNAFTLLKLIDYQWRTPETHQIAFNLLLVYPQSIVKIIQDLEFANLFKAFARDDLRIQTKLLDLADQALKALFTSKKLDFAPELIAYVEEVDQLRASDLSKQLAFNYIENGDYTKANYYFEKSNQLSLSITEKAWLLFKGYYFSRFLLFCIISLTATYLFIRSSWSAKFRTYLYKLKQLCLSKLSLIKFTPYGKGLRQAYEQPEERVRFNSKTFVSQQNEQKSPQRLEYEQLLSIFGLTYESSEKDLKNAYRSIVKKVHPDLKKRQSMSHSADFVKLTRDYERLMALRKELF